MILTWLIYLMIMKGYASGNGVDDWKESPNAWLSLSQNAINQCSPSCKYSRLSSIDDSYSDLNLIIGSISDVQKSKVINSAIPETSYPISILDSSQPFYYITAAQDNVLGPFTKDVQNTYQTLTSKSSPEKKSHDDTLNKDSIITFITTRVNENRTLRCVNVFDIIHIEQELTEIMNTSQLQLNIEDDQIQNTSIEVHIEIINENITFTKNVEVTSLDENYDFDKNITCVKEDYNEIHENEFDYCINDFATINDTFNNEETSIFNNQLVAPPIFNQSIEFEEITKSFISEERENVEYYIEESDEIAKCAKALDMESTSDYSSSEFSTECSISPTY